MAYEWNKLATKKELDQLETDIAEGNIVVAQATNATNAVVNSDGTHSALVRDANNVLKIDDRYIVQLKELILSTGDTGNFGIVETKSYNMPESMVLGEKYVIEFTNGDSRIIETTEDATQYNISISYNQYSTSEADGRKSFYSNLIEWCVDFTTRTMSVVTKVCFENRYYDYDDCKYYITSAIVPKISYIYKIIG